MKSFGFSLLTLVKIMGCVVAVRPYLLLNNPGKKCILEEIMGNAKD